MLYGSDVHKMDPYSHMDLIANKVLFYKPLTYLLTYLLSQLVSQNKTCAFTSGCIVLSTGF